MESINKKKASKTIIVVLILSFMFYWISVRPVVIRKGCYGKARTYATQFTRNGGIDKSQFDTYYPLCLHKQGL